MTVDKDQFEQLRAEASTNGSDLRILPAPNAPMEVARELVAERYTGRDGTLTLRHWRGGWWEWQGPRLVETEHRAMSSAAYAFTEHAVHHDASGKPQPWAPNRRKIADLLDALIAIVHLSENVSMPAWLDGTGYSGLVVSVANGLLDVGRRELLAHDPRFFNATSVPFDFDPDTLDPERWEAFLEDLWGGDRDSIQALSEWFGYVISGRLDLHKILLIVGPTRAGKGVISRTLGKLVGAENVAGPTLSSLSGDFGLAPLLGKSLAVVSDARLNGRGAHVVVERLLSISGEDTLTVNHKYRDQWTGKLPARLMLCSNELPHLGDASMAIAGRFVPLLLSQSFYGKEDLELEDKLAGELPGILNWALTGLERLSENGKFTRPPNVDDTIRTLQDLASPVGAFVRDRCEIGPDRTVMVDELEPADPRLPLSAVIEQYEAAHAGQRANTRGAYRSAFARIEPILGRKRITAITRADVRRFVSIEIEAGLKANTIRSHYSALRAVFNFAASDLEIPVNFPKLKPAELPDPVDDQREHRVLSDDELQRVLAACDERSRLFFRTVAETGCRASEALGLTPKRVGDGTIALAEQLARDGSLRPLKTRQSKRTIEVTRGLSAELRLAGDRERVFPRLSHREIERQWATALERAKLEAPCPVIHDLRHTHASRLIALGWDPVEIAKRLGDRVETVLRTYVHAFDARRRSAERRDSLESLYGQDGYQMATYAP